MNYLASISKVAEKRRGIIFKERFKSVAEVEKNGGTIAGTVTVENGVLTTTPTATISYDSVDIYDFLHTVSYYTKIINNGNSIIGNDANNDYIAFYQTSTEQFFYRFGTSIATWNNISLDDNNWHRIDIVRSSSTEVELYVDLVSQGAKSVAANRRNKTLVIGGIFKNNSISDNCQFKNINIFNSALTAEEIQAYHNNSMWNYGQNLLTCMDGRFRKFDPDNSRHLDSSPNGNHFQLGDGAGNNEPVKRADRGYTFEAGDYMKLVDLGTISIKTIAGFLRTSINSATTGKTLIEFNDTTNLGVFLGSFSGLATNETLSIANAGDITYIKQDLENPFVCITYNDNLNKYEIYVNGKMPTQYNSGTDCSLISSVDSANIGRRNINDLFLLADLFDLRLLTTGLNATQIADLHERVRREVRV